MIDPASISVATKVLISKNVAESVVAGSDPSLTALVSAAFLPNSENSPITPIAQQSQEAQEYIVVRKDIGMLTQENKNIQARAVVEQYVDSKYLHHGNLDDAWGSLKAGQLTFDCFVLAMVDVVDVMTFGLFKPLLLEVKINPHLQAREVVYRAEVSYDTPETNVFTANDSIVKKEEQTTTNRRITQVSKITFEISPEAFKSADLSFAEAVAKCKDAMIADRTVLYARLDELTEKDIKIFSEQGPQLIERSSQRLRSAETTDDLLGSGERNLDDIVANGGGIIEDKERLHTIATPKEKNDVASANGLDIKQIENTGIDTHGENVKSSDQIVRRRGEQIEKIDYIAGTKDTSARITEDIATVQTLTSASKNIFWTHEINRTRIAEGSQDIFTLHEFSADAFVAEGAQLLADKAKIKDTIVAVDISNSGEKINFVGKDTKSSWLIRESDISKSTAESSERQISREGTQIAEYDYLANSGSILESSIKQQDIVTNTVTNIVETKTHWNLFGWKTGGFLGEKIQTGSTPTVTRTTYTQEAKLAEGDSIFSSLNKPIETIATQGGQLTTKTRDTVIEHKPTETIHDFEEGKITFIPFVGGLGHLASKASLGGQVTLSDAFWAAADVAEIATTVVAVAAALPTGGGSVAAQVAATSTKTAAKIAVKTAAKTIAKSAAKTGGKAVVSGTIHIAGKDTAKMASRAVGQLGTRIVNTKVKNAVTQTGKLSLENAGKAGAKTTIAESGSIVRYKNIPKNNGHWLGEPGNSKWKPDLGFIPKKLNPQNKSMGSILADNKIDGVNFKQGAPDLRKVAQDTVKIDNYTVSRPKNFAQADSKLAEIYNKQGLNEHAWTKGDIARLRKSEGLTWHERADMKTLDLVKSDLHANVSHSGGISELKKVMNNATNNTVGVL